MNRNDGRCSRPKPGFKPLDKGLCGTRASGKLIGYQELLKSPSDMEGHNSLSFVIAAGKRGTFCGSLPVKQRNLLLSNANSCVESDRSLVPLYKRASLRKQKMKAQVKITRYTQTHVLL